MRKIQAALFAAALLLTLGSAAQAVDLETALTEGPIYSDLRAAVAASALSLDEPLVFERKAEGEVWVLQITGLASGKVDHVRVVPNAPIGKPTGWKSAERYAYNVVGGTTRCTIELYDGTSYATLIQLTDMDWNDLGYISGVNDRISSMKTGCNPVWFYSDKNFAGTYTSYVPAYSNLTSIGAMNNRISSFLHDLP